MNTFKVIVVGDVGVGKSSFIQRYTNDVFCHNYKSTIGLDWFEKKVLKNGENVALQFWDIGGQERFGKLTRTYYKGAAAAILVYDVTRHSTFESITKWKADIDSKVMLQDGSPVPCILVANKIDLNNPAITTKQAHDYCRQNQFAGFFETSVKLSMGILESIEFLLDILVDKEFASSLIETGDFVVIDSNDVGSVKMEDLMQTKKKRACSSCSSISSL